MLEKILVEFVHLKDTFDELNCKSRMDRILIYAMCMYSTFVLYDYFYYNL